MDTNLTTHYAAIQIDRSRLSAHAERGWVAEQAAAGEHSHPATARVRQWVGGLMILAGQHIQGMPAPALTDLQPSTPA